jgi:alpha-glucosidase
MRMTKYRFMICAIAMVLYSMAAIAQSVSSVTVTGNTVRCALSNGSAVDFSPANDYMVRVEYRQANANSAVSDLMDANYSSTAAFTNINQSGDPVVLTGPNYSISIAKATFGIVFKNSAGTVLFSSSAVSQFTLNGTIVAGNYYGISNQTYFSLGVLYSGSNNLIVSGNGQTYQIFDAYNMQEGGAASPFTWTPKGFGLFIDAEQGSFSFGTTTLSVTRKNPGCANTNCLFWLISGTPNQIMASYYKASGSFPVPPRWSCGFMNSQWGMAEADLKSEIQTYRNKSIPLDAFILDYDWFDYNNQNGVTDGDFQFNTLNYPTASTNYNAATGGDLKRWLDGQGVKLIGIRKPHGIWTGVSTWGNCGNFYDATIRKTFWEKFINPSWDSYGRGVIGYWNDEADACTNISLPFEPLNMEKAMYTGQRYDSTAGLPSGYHNNRIWSLNRSYFGGAQKYAYGHWSGDISCGNQDLQDSRIFMLTSINLGSAWWGQDIGGFQTDPTAAEYQHWMQLGAFSPIYRVHGNNGCKRMPWVYTSGYTHGTNTFPADGGVAERVAKEYILLRYSLIPYIYSAYWKLHRDGLPIVRPLVMEYPADNNVSENIDSWMFGDNLLVSPVVTNYTATTKSVYLPAGTWYNFWTDAVYTGGAATSIPTNIDTIPVLVKQGAIIPRQAIVQYINNYPVTQNTSNSVVPVSIHVYGGANSTYDYFDDDGVTYNYESGQYRTIVYTHTSSTSDEQITVGAKQGTYTPAADSNGYFVFHGINWTPLSVSAQSGDITASQVAVTALAATAAPAWSYDQAKKLVTVKVASPFTQGTVRVANNTSVQKVPSTVSLRSTKISLSRGHLLIPIMFTGSCGLTVRLITASGAVAKEYKFSSLPQGEQTLSMPTGNLTRGVCFAQLTSGTFSVLRKIVVVR